MTIQEKIKETEAELLKQWEFYSAHKALFDAHLHVVTFPGYPNTVAFTKSATAEVSREFGNDDWLETNCSRYKYVGEIMVVVQSDERSARKSVSLIPNPLVA